MKCENCEILTDELKQIHEAGLKRKTGEELWKEIENAADHIQGHNDVQKMKTPQSGWRVFYDDSSWESLKELIKESR